MNIGRELKEIGQLLNSVNLLSVIRKEVMAVMHEGTMVTDSQDKKYDVLIRAQQESQEKIARRIRENVPDIEIERIADNILGIRDSRRTK